MTNINVKFGQGLAEQALAAGIDSGNFVWTSLNAGFYTVTAPVDETRLSDEARKLRAKFGTTHDTLHVKRAYPINNELDRNMARAYALQQPDADHYIVVDAAPMPHAAGIDELRDATLYLNRIAARPDVLTA